MLVEGDEQRGVQVLAEGGDGDEQVLCRRSWFSPFKGVLWKEKFYQYVLKGIY